MNALALGALARTSQPPVARLGFDEGWLLLGPTFLDLRRPVLLVDKILIGPTSTLGLEPFNSRNPRVRLNVCRIQVVTAGSGISLWTGSGASRCLLAAGWEVASRSRDICWATHDIILLVGDTYAVEVSWSAIFACLIGAATVQGTDRRARQDLTRSDA